MNEDIVKGSLQELKGKVRQAWAKLTDDDVESAKGNWEELTGKVQKAYGYDKDKASDEVAKFKEKWVASAKKDDCCGGH